MKLEIYNKLAYVIGFFVFFVTIVTFILIMARNGLFPWPWRLYWAQTVLWEVLNLGILIAVSVIWRPSERAALLAHSLQLTTDEYTEDAFNDEDEIPPDYEHDDEDDDDDEQDLDEEGGARGAGRSPSPRSVQFKKKNIAPFSDVSYDQEDGDDETNDFSVDACVIKGDGIEMRSPGSRAVDDEQEEEEDNDDDYNSLPTVAG
jgi:hypothetical protein